VHSGYPGLFNWLVFLPMGLASRHGGEAGATVAGRAVVASFATLNVWLLYLVARRPWGEWAALLAAALLAFSRSEVSEAHFITPDVLVVSAFLALLLMARSERSAPGPASGRGWARRSSTRAYCCSRPS
jgi:dolichyl-phosphate-mannose--protein O-mannosyl transferase